MQKKAYELRISDWSSDVCSSDLSEALAQLEGGAGAVITSSGMAAVDLLLGQLKPKDLVIAPHDCYGGTYRLLKARADRGHFSLRFIDQSNHSAFAAVLEDVPALVLIETPSNPLMRVVDIAALASKAKARSEEHMSELQSLMRISYAVFCLKKHKQNNRAKQIPH